MFKKLRLLIIYIRILKKNREILKQQHGINIDWVWRMYKTYVIPQEEIRNVKEYGFSYVNTLIQKELAKIDKTFLHMGLSEYVGLMDAVNISEREIGLAFRFKFLNTAKLFSKFVWSILMIIGGGIGFYYGNFIGLGIGLISIFVIYLITRLFVKK
jgi:hypothetical protein